MRKGKPAPYYHDCALCPLWRAHLDGPWRPDPADLGCLDAITMMPAGSTTRHDYTDSETGNDISFPAQSIAFRD